MSDLWREWLYPLGFLSAGAFSGRMLLQWVSSEAKGRSTVMPAFWILSLIGNILLAAHSFIQIQIHVCLIQACNGVISWRNLNLMQPKESQVTLQTTLLAMAGAVLSVIGAFWIQSHYLMEDTSAWFRIPSTPWQSSTGTNISIAWHLIGFFGLALFASRFWIQWLGAEIHKKSYLSGSFWWASLIGDLVCTIYFFAIGDPVNYLGPLFGLVVYTRNLMLIHKSKTSNPESL